MTDYICYFLYDNRSQSRIGLDWGLKVAPHNPSGDATAKRTFLRYCEDSFDTRVGPLADFTAGLGGFPIGQGYVLCVTFECKDRAGRQSLAIVGLEISSRENLKQFLENWNPVDTALGVFLESEPPSVLRPAGAGLACSDSGLFSRLVEARSLGIGLIERFQPGRSLLEVKELLLHAASASHIRLPRVLGVTGVMKPSRFSEAFYEIVLCHAARGFVESGLTAYLESQQAYIQRARDGNPGGVGYRNLAAAKFRAARMRESFLPPKSAVFLLLVLGISLLAYLLFWWGGRKPEEMQQPVDRAITSQEVGIADPGPGALEVDVGLASNLEDVRLVDLPEETYLADVKLAVASLGSLDLEDLRRSEALRIATEVEVVAEHRAERLQLIQVLSESIPRLHRQLIKLNLVYFFEENQKDLPKDAVAREIEGKLAQVDFSDVSCEKLRTAFGFEFERVDSSLNRWCTAFDKLSVLARRRGGDK